MPRKDRDDDSKKQKDKDIPSDQPPPPGITKKDNPPGPKDHHHKEDDKHHPHKHDHPHHYHHHEHLYTQLNDVRKTLDTLLTETREAKMQKRYELIPVRVSDLMKGFQAALSRANSATLAGEEAEEDIAAMSVKDLEISLSAPIIEGGHLSDPVIMLPNIKGADGESAQVSMKFNIVSVPAKQRG